MINVMYGQVGTAFLDVYWWNQIIPERPGPRAKGSKGSEGRARDPVKWEAGAPTSFTAWVVSLDKSYHRVLCSSLLCYVVPLPYTTSYCTALDHPRLLCCAVLCPHTILHHTALC